MACIPFTSLSLRPTSRESSPSIARDLIETVPLLDDLCVLDFLEREEELEELDFEWLFFFLMVCIVGLCILCSAK
jgi:hypothetical protein